MNGVHWPRSLVTVALLAVTHVVASEPAATATASPLQISAGPANAKAFDGQRVRFTVRTSGGDGTVAYQWFRNGAVLSGATGASYVTPPLKAADDGARYSVRASSAGVARLSAEAQVDMLTAPSARKVGVSVGSEAYGVRSNGSIVVFDGDDWIQTNPLSGSQASLVPGISALQVSAGSQYTLALAADGRVFGWGVATNQLGSSTAVLSPRVQPGNLTGVKAVRAGNAYAWAVRSDGSLWHWPGRTELSMSGKKETPKQVAGLTQVVKVARGVQLGLAIPALSSETGDFALRSDGSVWALIGALASAPGSGGAVVFTNSVTAVRINGLSNIADLSCSRHCIALRKDRSVIAWGANDYGQIGNGLAGADVALGKAFVVSGLPGDVVSVVALDSGSAAMTASGRVFTWGAGAGHGDVGALYRPIELRLPAPAVAIDADSRAAIALADGRALIFDTNPRFSGAVTRATAVGGLSMLVGAPQVTGGPASRVAGVGQTVSYSATVTGTGPFVWQWLRDGAVIAGAHGTSWKSPPLALPDDGARLSLRVTDTKGARTVGNATLTVTATAGSPDRPWRVLADRIYDYRAPTSGTWTWGDGSPSASGSAVSKVWALPGKFAAVSPAGGFSVDAVGRQLALGREHQCAVRADGALLCWGRNDFGQLGNGGVIETMIATPVSGLTKVVSVSAGLFHTCAVTADGKAWCWGRNFYGQLGDGTKIDRFAPRQVTGITDAAAIAVGDWHSCVVRRSGAVRCWGLNRNYEVGDGTSVESRPSPTAVSGLSDAVALSVGKDESCAIRRSGALVCWGAGTMSTPTAVSGFSKTAAISHGSQHFCALRQDRQLRCWGENGAGQLGDGSFTARSDPTAPVGLGAAVAVTASAERTCAMLASGEVRCWGAGSPLPAKVNGLPSAARTIFSGYESPMSCAAVADGSFWCWGSGGPGDGGTAIGGSPLPLRVRGWK